MGFIRLGRFLPALCFFCGALLPLQSSAAEDTAVLHADFESAQNPENIPICMPFERTAVLYSNFYNLFKFTATNVDTLMFRIAIESNLDLIKRISIGQNSFYEYGNRAVSMSLCKPGIDDWSMKWNIGIYVSRTCRARITGVPAGILTVMGGPDKPSYESRFYLQAVDEKGETFMIGVPNGNREVLPIGRYYLMLFRDLNKNYTPDPGEGGRWFPGADSLETSEPVLIRPGLRTVVNISGMLGGQ